ncbi:hypothetical protein IQ07DRAFT_638911 [Pyrenochaeta sp. DS3sAY3a]|nr:hypothetical protein IQ07DRAFT_638911 [Pyrenochaeta sp. DS3sAY3a]
MPKTKYDPLFWLQCLDPLTQCLRVIGPFHQSEVSLMIEKIQGVYMSIFGYRSQYILLEKDTIESSMTQILEVSSGEFKFTDGSLLSVKRIYDERLWKFNLDVTATCFYSVQIRHLPECLSLDDGETLKEHLKKHYMLPGMVRGEVETIRTERYIVDAEKRVKKILKRAAKEKHEDWKFNAPLSMHGLKVYGCYEASSRNLPLKMVVIQATLSTREDRYLTDDHWSYYY